MIEENEEIKDLTIKIPFPNKRINDFRVRLQYENLSQVKFYKILIEAFLVNDERIISVISEWKNQNTNFSKNKIRKNQKLVEKGNQLMSKFGLNDGEIESIFDLLEEEHPDL